jgi:hypothetical protein
MTTPVLPQTSSALAVLTDLAACLCDEIDASGLPGTCFCGVVPGDAAAQDYAGNCKDGKCGMAWVRLLGAYPASGVAAQDQTPGNCGAGIGADIEVGIMRCMIVGDAQGNPPTPTQLLDTTALQMADAEAMRRAILCCSTIPNHDMLLGTYTPLGPNGGLVGGVWSLSVAF